MRKRIVCYGDSNTWGYDAVTDGRFPEEVRWTGKLQELLGEEYCIIEEGLCGRTTVFEDPLNEGLNGLTYLYPCLMSHGPLDLLVIMLGTNDSKERFSATPKNIADGMKRLVKKQKKQKMPGGTNRRFWSWRLLPLRRRVNSPKWPERWESVWNALKDWRRNLNSVQSFLAVIFWMRRRM